MQKENEEKKVKGILVDNWEDYNPGNLSIEQAQEIMAYKKRSTYRSLALKYLGIEYQILGTDLSVDAACKILNISDKELWELNWDDNPELREDHKHILGDFFWWE
jgi:hypothetical protein